MYMEMKMYVVGRHIHIMVKPCKIFSLESVDFGM